MKLHEKGQNVLSGAVILYCRISGLECTMQPVFGNAGNGQLLVMGISHA